MSLIDVLEMASGLPWRAPDAPTQLALPGLDVPVDRWDVLVAGTLGAVRVRAVFHADRLELTVLDRPSSVGIGYDDPPSDPVLAEVMVQTRGQGWASGSMFGEPLWIDGWALSADDAGPGGALGDLGREIAEHVGAGPRAPALLSALLCDIAERVALLCDPRAIAMACTFDPANRLAVHALLADDRTGRLGQLTRVAPGLVTIIAKGRARGRGRAAYWAVVGGERLAVVADRLSEDMWGLEPRSAAANAQRTWLLGAPAALSASVLDRPAPRHLVVDDLPSDARDAAAFYEVMAAVDDALTDEDDALLTRGLVRFVSRHAVKIRTLDDWGGRVTRLVHQVRRTKHGPTRRAPLAQWLPLGVGHRGNPFLRGSFDLGYGAVTRLESRAALRREGRELRHCAEDLADVVARGAVAVFRLETEEHRATLALAWDNDAGVWRVSEFAGPGNAAPAPSAAALALSFVRAHHGSSSATPRSACPQSPSRPPREPRRCDGDCAS